MSYSHLPVGGKFRITCEFGREGNWAAGFHTGVDLVSEDKVIYSPTYGKVYRIGQDASYGNYVDIIDEDGDHHWLCHLASINSNDITNNAKVTPSTIVGIMGATGRATGVHLHYEIRNHLNKYGLVINPEDWTHVPNEVGTYNESDFSIYGDEIKTLRRSTNLRNAPTINSSECTTYIANTTLKVLEPGVTIADGYTWDKVQIRVTGQVGYMINKNYK